ncbi:MAG: hypothetical protein PWR20_290 [Bacteroidales bacterium]|jgi:hypothetical protein|nr:hypothetical protein [Bacteroidales bacterium]MDN5328348.1 hypothetical protein [Bacteroidales bacterium]
MLVKNLENFYVNRLEICKTLLYQQNIKRGC